MALWNLPKLIGFCRGTGEIEFPQLKELSLGRLPQLKWLFLNSSNPFSESMENHNATFISLFPHKVALPSLEELELEDFNNLEGLEHIPISVCSFSKLRKLHVKHCGKWLCVFPSQFLTRLGNLEDLTVENFSLLEKVFELEIVDYEKGQGKSSVDKIEFTQLKILRLYHLPNLVSFFLEVIATSATSTERLQIKNCSMMEEVVAKEEGEEKEENRTPLPKLKCLELKDLPELKSFCHVTHDWELPLVDDITILNCPKMKSFSPGVVCTPKLQCVFVKERKYKWPPGIEGEDWLWISDLNQTIMHLIEKSSSSFSSNDMNLVLSHIRSQGYEVCCIDVEILSRCLEAKLTVCCCFLSRDKELGEGCDSTEVCNRESFGQKLPLGNMSFDNDIFESMGHFVDGLKFFGGSHSLMPKAYIKEVTKMAHKHNVYVSTGDWDEHLLHKGPSAFKEYIEECKQLGFDTIELNVGSLGVLEETLLRFI
ncbi:Protein HEAT-STRESS-ASSOCIATED 32 [Camellia lanceoleosa]|uniref:Protein HEAT-STRESS-ASSOCIATED 32 n=1 Tax=Camellia lanceoleosa TaxID=1840588 RepID=A0ACC0FRI4_9ERIC|nr:Protein HEAT-STRESS-ASSOCIATED 32 [Camellia lanceoleosa]